MHSLKSASTLVFFLSLFPFSALSAQTGYLPPNPITPPTVSPPVMASPLTVTPPVVTSTLKPAAAAATPAKTTTSSLPASLSDLTSPVSLLNALGGSGDNTEGLDALSTLLGGGTGALGASGGATAATDGAAAANLQKILALLEKQQAQLDAQAKDGKAAASKAAAASAIKSGAQIVRFSVNGNNIVTPATEIISSSLAKDSSFLLTGNRNYTASNTARTETFYLFCRKSGALSYQVYADVSQDYLNEYSYMYQLARKTPLTGKLTGDLLVIRTDDPAWRLDLVIRIITPTVQSSSVR